MREFAVFTMVTNLLSGPFKCCHGGTEQC